MSITQVKVGLVGALIVAGIAASVWQQTRLERARAENARIQTENAQLRAQEKELADVRGEVARLRSVETDHAELERLRQWQAKTQPELLRLRGMAGVARRANVEAEELRAQLTRQASEAGTNPIPGAMADATKRAMDQQTERRLSRMTASLHLSPEQAQAARDVLMRQAQVMLAGMQQGLSGKFDKEELARLAKEAGNPEENIKALLTPDQKAAYPSYVQEEAAYNARLAANTELLQLQSTLGLSSEQQDRAFAALYEIGFNQLTGKAKPPSGKDQAEAMQWALEQKAIALEPVLTATQIADYRQQQAAQAKLIKDVMSKMQPSTGSK
jgi:hypothetical protein